MTAESALASMREDIDRLEAKGLVKPGFIRRRRSEVDAIEEELQRLTRELERLKEATGQLLQERLEADQLTGRLANYITTLGFSFDRVLTDPDPNATEVYHRAAGQVLQARRANRTRGINLPPESAATKLQLLQRADAAIWEARLHFKLQRSAARTGINLPPHGQEEQQAAA